MERASGYCERCFHWAGEDLHADHFFGRAKAEETPANVWALCVSCDHMKTNNQPHAQIWLQWFSLHASLHGYADAAKRAQDKLAVQVLKFGEKP